MEVDVITPSKISQKASEAPGNIIVVTNQQIRERGYLNLVDLLEDLPNIDIQRKSAPNPFNRITIRDRAGNSNFIIMQKEFDPDLEPGEQGLF